MMKSYLGFNLIDINHITSHKKNACFTAHIDNEVNKNLSPISIQNVDTTLPEQNNTPFSPNALIKKLHQIENNADATPPLSVSVAEKLFTSTTDTLIPIILNKKNEEHFLATPGRYRRRLVPDMINNSAIHQYPPGNKEIANQLNKKIEFERITQALLDKNLEFIKSYYYKKTSLQPSADKTSLDWWVNKTKWNSLRYPANKPSDPKKMTIETDSGQEINIINTNDKWYLNDWTQQKAYLYATLDGLEMLSEECQNILDDILYRIFKTNPETSPECALKIVHTTLAMLMFINSQNTLYVMDILQIKYLLMFAIPDKIEPFFLDIEQIYTLVKLKIIPENNWEALQKSRFLLHSTGIDSIKYKAAYKTYQEQPFTVFSNDPYHKGIAECEQFLHSEPINEKNSQYIFIKALFYFTKKQSVILSNATITQEEQDELIELGVAKYHLYVVFKFFNVKINEEPYKVKEAETAKFDEIFPEINLVKRQDPDAAGPTSQKNNATLRLIAASKLWKDYSASPWKQETPGIDGKIYAVSRKKYIYLRGLLWEIFQASEDHIVILAEKNNGKEIALEAICTNDIWDIADPEAGQAKNITQLNIQLALIKLYFDLNDRHQPMSEITSLHWWLYQPWKETQSDLSTKPDSVSYNQIIIINNKKYLYIYPNYWEYENEDGNTTRGILKNRLGATLKVIFNESDGQWYLNDWPQQKIYLYANLDGLKVLPESCRAKLEEILRKIFETNPEIPLDRAISIADTVLSILLFQNIHDKAYANNILQIKYFLMLILPDRKQQFINVEQINILYRLDVSMNLRTLEADLYQLYPTSIDNKKYTTALTNVNADNIDESDPYEKGIAYCNNLISKFKNEDNHLAFNKILFHLTEKELEIPITEDKNKELAWLNIAKYHLYTEAKYFLLHESMGKYADKAHFGTDKNILSVLKQARIEAVKIYYRDQENVSNSYMDFNDEDILREYNNIIALKNNVSEYLEMAVAALFYQAYHSGETFSGFDFIKAKSYYIQQVEQFLKDIYTFDSAPPDNMMYHYNFKPSSNFSSRSDYIKQFNEYVDGGSSDYESKLLTSLLLHQTGISLEDLSLPPKRWFTAQLYCYDYPKNHLGWSVHDTFVWPEKLNIIQLHSGNYLTISEINGNMKLNLIPEAAYNFSLQESAKKDTYFYAKDDNPFFNALIGPIPPTKQAQRNCELKVYEEKKTPNLIKIAVQQALHASLDAWTGYQKSELEEVSFTQTLLEIFVPFYGELYHALTDSKYIINKPNLLIDAIFIAPALKAAGINLKLLGETAANETMAMIKKGMDKGLNQAALAGFVVNEVSKKYISETSLLAKNELEDLIISTSVDILPLDMIREDETVAKIQETQATFPLDAQIQYPISLEAPGKFGRYKGIYTIPATKTGDEARYFIKNEEKIYQVRWDKNKYTWRLIENGRLMGMQYGMPIQYLAPDKWIYDATLRLRGGGIETQKIITTTDEAMADFNKKHQTEVANKKNDGIFYSKNTIEDSAAILEMNKVIVKAKNTALDMINKAINVFHDKQLTPKIKKLMEIFINKNDEENFLNLLKKLKKVLKYFDPVNDIKLVDEKNSSLLAQIFPYGYSTKKSKYLAINYSTYKKSHELIFTEEVSKAKKEYWANENFARTLIHEFTHTYDIAGSTDAAGYVELLGLNGKHDVTKLLLRAKLGLPEVKNNADSLTEVIFMLSKIPYFDVFLDVLLEEYQNWEINVERRMQELYEKIKSSVADKIQLSWRSTKKADIVALTEAYKKEMCNQLISEVNQSNAFIFDTIDD